MFGLVLAAMAAPRAAWSQSAVWLPQGTTSGNIYYNNGNVRIGTANPSNLLQVGTGTNNFASFNFYSGGTVPTPEFGSQIGTNETGGQGETNFWNGYPSAYRSFDFRQITGAGAFKTLVTVLANCSAGIGITNPPYQLSVKNTVGAGEVIMTNTSGWSDYVFSASYRLRPLSELRAYIQSNHHLPDIPSDAEVKERGVSPAEMQSKLFAKIEELTLHTIQSDKRNAHLQRENQNLLQQNREIQARLDRLGAN